MQIYDEEPREMTLEEWSELHRYKDNRPTFNDKIFIYSSEEQARHMMGRMMPRERKEGE